jgi:hypothetical protein
MVTHLESELLFVLFEFRYAMIKIFLDWMMKINPFRSDDNN